MECKENRCTKEGMIAIPLLFFVLALSFLAQILLKQVVKEYELESNDLKEKQIIEMTSSLAKVVIANEASINESIDAAKTRLKPSNSVVESTVMVSFDDSIPLKKVKITSKCDNIKYSINFLKIFPPGGVKHKIYKYGIISKKNIVGFACNELEEELIAQNILDIPVLDERGYENNSLLSLPSTEFTKTVFLSNRLYSGTSNKINPVEQISINTASGTIPSYGGSNYYYVNSDVKFVGRAVFFNRNPIIFRKNSSWEGMGWIICGNTVYIEDGVNLNKVLIFADGNIIIGKNVTINGIMVSRYNVKIGENFHYTRDESVIKPFITALYHKY